MLAYSQLRSVPRVALADAVPLALPFALFVEPTNVCNFRCEMCPESLPDYQQQAGYYRRMPMTTFHRVISEMKEWGRVKVLRFYFVGEPLLNPDLPEMIRVSKQAGIAGRIEITSNASLLTESWAKELIESGLDYLRVSVYALEEGEHRRVTGSKFGAAGVRENVKRLRAMRDALGSTRPHISAQWFSQSPEADATFKGLFDGVADETVLEQRHNWSGSDERLVSIGQGARRYMKEACPQPFFTLVVKANGDITVCCCDWNGGLVIGNMDSGLKAAWEGDKLRELQVLHLEKRRSEIPACRDCTLLHNFPDNLDQLEASEFLQRIPKN